MTLDDTLHALRDAIQIDVGNRGLARDLHDNLFTAFPDDFAAACRSIADHPSPRVGIVTGFMIPAVDPPIGETDGPPGALFLARVFTQLDIPCVHFSDAAGLTALRLGASKNTPVITLAANVPCNLALTHFIALERSGPSYDFESIPPEHRGRNHTMRGRDITDLTAPGHLLFEGRRPYVTIGIGDGGNEIGMGKVPYSTICKNIPNGEVVACRTATDYLIVAGISNWGAYALAAGVMLLRNRMELGLFDVENEHNVLKHLVENAPLVDGVSGQRTTTVDGLAFAEYARPLQRIRTLLETLHAANSERR